MRHHRTQVLWVQEAVARRELTAVKVPGVENPADMETKHLVQKEMHECLRRSSMPHHPRTVEEGRTGGLSQARLRLRKQINNIVQERAQNELLQT